MAVNQFQPPKKPARPVKDAFNQAPEDTVMLSLKVSKRLHRKLKMYSASEGIPMTQILEDLIEEL